MPIKQQRVAGVERTTVFTAMMTAAAIGFIPAFAEAEDIAVSLVHARGRIDIPVNAISRVEARATFTFRNTETGEVREHPGPHVEICFSADIRQRICDLTRQIVGQPMEVVVDCAAITKPIVREPLCTRPCFQISANGIAEANALAQRIRRGSNKACAPSS